MPYGGDEVAGSILFDATHALPTGYRQGMVATDKDILAEQADTVNDFGAISRREPKYGTAEYGLTLNL